MFTMLRNLLFVLTIAALSMGSEARVGKKERKLQNNQQYYNNGYNYNNGQYNNANQYNNGNYYANQNQYQYQNQNYQYQNQGYYDQNGNWVQQEGEAEGSQDEAGSQDQGADNAQYNYASDAVDDDAVDDQFQFDMAHYKKLLEVHSMMEFYRLCTALFGVVIFIMAIAICVLRKQLQWARSEQKPTLSLAKPLAPNSPYTLGGNERVSLA